MQKVGIRDVLRILRPKPASHTRTASDDMIILRRHIAILKKKRVIQPSSYGKGGTCTRSTMIKEANAQLIYGNACRVGIRVGVRRHYDAKLSHNSHISMAKQKMNESGPLCPEKF